MRQLIPYTGIGGTAEVEKFFHQTKVAGAEKGIEGGLERLRIYDTFTQNIEQSKTEVVEAA
ncbi:MAG: hypothetical protein AABX62_03530 [Thermoproteota archaeon]|jgi:hypothetical protein